MAFIELTTDDRDLVKTLINQYAGCDYRIEVNNEAELLRLVVIRHTPIPEPMPSL